MMAPQAKGKVLKKRNTWSQFGFILIAECYLVLFHFKYFNFIAVLLLLFELILNIVIVWYVPYTEIDWIAYMQEVEGVINGTLDYSKLQGDTGPLVYPAGFVYVYALLYFITDHGQNVRMAQYVFVFIYLVTLFLLYRLYNASKKVPPYVLVICCCIAYRIHSIYVLRLFNDPIAILFLYLALNLFLSERWTLGSVVYSMAVSIKMNILLYAPALLLAYITLLGYKNTVKQLIICAFVQLILGLPFLLSNPYAYIKRSFDLGRVFFFKWTVNWRFIPEDVFLSSYFHILLLLVHVYLLCYFCQPMYHHFRIYASLKQLEKRVQLVDMRCISHLLLLPFFISNFIGIMCSRSLHYQFYVWYYHTLPFLLWSTTFSNCTRLLVFGIIELCWNTFPSTKLSSISLFVCHAAILSNLMRKFKLKGKA